MSAGVVVLGVAWVVALPVMMFALVTFESIDREDEANK